VQLARATAHSNIALVKYWGKREGAPDQNLPAVGSLSLTLADLRSVTQIAPQPPGEPDQFVLDGDDETSTPAGRKALAHLDRVWVAAAALGWVRGARPPVAIDSVNHLPTAAGLASSASGFAALTLAAVGAFGLPHAAADGSSGWTRRWVSALARRGSGSAARSLWGGFVRLDRGDAADGHDCVAGPLAAPAGWDLRLLVVHTTRGAKDTASTAGMERSRTTSPYYAPWVATSEADLAAAQAAIAAADLPALGAVMERSCFKMHACMLATDPALLYWNGVTVEAIHAVRRARERGLLGFLTIDAGPHVKVLCAADQAQALAAELAAVPGVVAVQSVAPGPSPSLDVGPTLSPLELGA
jgi:diphosphomevalonate decarboxylase